MHHNLQSANLFPTVFWAHKENAGFKRCNFDSFRVPGQNYLWISESTGCMCLSSLSQGEDNLGPYLGRRVRTSNRKLRRFLLQEKVSKVQSSEDFQISFFLQNPTSHLNRELLLVCSASCIYKSGTNWGKSLNSSLITSNI